MFVYRFTTNQPIIQANRRRRGTSGSQGGGGTGSLYPDLAYTLPTGMTFNRSTNKPEGSPLQIRYSDDPITTWINLETNTASGTLSADPANNMTVLQNWVTNDGTVGVRRGYEYSASREFEGDLELRHNSGSGWSGFRPIGYTYDANLKTPPTTSSAYPTIRTTVANGPAVYTSVNGHSSSNHGRYAFFGHHFRVDTSLGGTQGSFNNGIVRFGSPGNDQASIAQCPVGFLLHDCTIAGNPGKYSRRGLEFHGGDLEIRAVTITEIHNSYTNLAAGGLTADAQCLITWNGEGRIEARYSIFHGGDECANLGGAASKIANLELGDVWFDHCEFSANDDYLFDAGPDNQAASFFWQKKNSYEQKVGFRVLHTFCRYSGIRSPNDNQGYAITVKTGAYGTLTPNQRSEDVQFHGCWIERVPGAFAFIVYESAVGDTGLEAHRIGITDTFGYNMDIAPYTQSNVRLVLAMNDTNDVMDGLIMRHCTFATSTTKPEVAYYAGTGSMTNMEISDTIMPYGDYGIFNSQGQGTNALNSMAGAGNYTVVRNTFVPKSTALSGYPATNDREASFAAMGMTDQANGDLTINATSSYYQSAPDGWNRGVTDPAMVLAELAETPTYL